MSTYPQHRDPEDRREKPQLLQVGRKTKKSSRVKRIAIWTAAGLAALIVLAIIAISTLPRIHSFREYALGIVENKLDAALGTRVHIEDFALSPWSLKLNVYGITIDGAAPYSSPPLLTVNHIGASVGVSSLMHASWYLRNLSVDHPVARVFVDHNGITNIPASKKNSSQSHISIFQLGVRHALLSNVEVFYNDRKSLLDADLHDLEFKAGFISAEEMYAGDLHYKNGHLRTENFNPIPHALDAEFEASPTKFILKHATLSSGNSKIEMSATVQNYANPAVNAEYSVQLESGDFREVMKNPALPAGLITARGDLVYENPNDVPMLAAIKLDAEIASPALNVQTADFRGEITNIGAHLVVDDGNASITTVHAGVMGGTVAGDLFVRDISNSRQARLHAEVRDISLAAIRPLRTSHALRQMSFAGTVNSKADATWRGSLEDLVAHANVNIAAGVGGKGTSSGNEIPVNGVIHADYSAAKQQVSLRQSHVQMAQTSLNLDGMLGKHSSVQLHLQANDLHELQEIATMFDPAVEEQARQMDLHGSASFTGSITGSTSAPQLGGQLTTANLRLRGSGWPVFKTNIHLSPSQASLQNGELQMASGGHITFSGSAGLQHWVLDRNAPIEVSLDAGKLDITDLEKLAHTQAPIAGLLSANISVRGNMLSPVGKGNVSIAKGRIGAEQLQTANISFQSTGDQLNAKLNLQIPAGGVEGIVTYAPQTQNYQVQLEAANIHLDELQTLKERDLPVNGVLSITAKGHGNIKNPAFEAGVESPHLVVRNQTLGDLKLQATLADHVANVAFDAHAVNTLCSAKAKINTTGNYQTDATIDTQTIPLQPLIAAYSPAEGENVSGQTALHLTLHGPLKDKSALEAHAIIPTLELNYGDKFHLAAAGPIHIDLSGGVLQMQKANIRGTGTDVQLQAKVPIEGNAPASLLAEGTLNLAAAQLFDPIITSSGEVKFDINSYGARMNPTVQGKVHIVNANFSSNDAPVGLQNGNGNLTLTNDRLNIDDFTGTVGGGAVQASGGIVYKPSVRFDLGLSGKGMRLLYPAGVRESLSANLNLSGTMEAAALGGQVRINQLWFTPDFDLTSFMGQFSSDVAAPPTEGFAQNLQLNLSVQSTNNVNLVSRELSLDGNANLTVRGTAAEPVILGRVNLNNGDLIFMGNRYLLQGGTIDFANASQTLPVLNVSASTTIQQYDIHLQFNGPADHLRTNYTSVPSLPPSDIINLLVFGETAEESAANPMPGNLGAESLIASQISSQVTSRVEKIAGISRLSIDPVLAGDSSGQNPGARVTIQQRVTGNIFVTFSTDVTQTQNQVIELQYNVSPKVTLSGTRDQNGGFGFDTRIKKTW